MWPLNVILQLFIILSLAYFPHAQIDFLPTANVSTSWTTITQPTNDHQLILFNQKPDADYVIGFACGFYTYQEKPNSFYFAVGFTEVLLDSTVSTSGKQTGSFIYTAWLANRNRPVGENATLQLHGDGNLVLKDADGILVWSTNTSKKSVVGMEMMETGNLVIYDANDATVWQSFDHPTDRLLPGQKLVAGKKIVASVSDEDVSEGNYNFAVTSEGLLAYYQADTRLVYLDYGSESYNNSALEGIVLMKDSIGSSRLYALPDHEYITHFWPSPPNKAASFVKLDPDGHLRLYGNDFEPIDILKHVLSVCNYPTVCGSYSLCSSGSCSCPPGFIQNNNNNSESQLGCSHINPINCENKKSLSLLDYQVAYSKIYTVPSLNGIDVESCKEACLENCSCIVALFQQTNTSSIGDCFLTSTALPLINDGANQQYGDPQPHAFIKVSNDAGNGTISDARENRRQAEVIAGSIVGAFLLICLAIGYFWIVVYKRSGKVEEETDADFDQLPGMPTRFTYEELKVATEDFQKRLGRGGFGSVYEGSLPNGEKIAVKRLEALGQGKKEFLAEVKTIGSIHHNNMVRIIGFCAEKYHRLMVYEFMCNGSLDKWIFLKEPLQSPLEWHFRRAIILDIAKGLAYLHEHCRQRIIHLDIKPQNILLDQDLHAKISDFGLSTLIDRDQSQVVTTMRGTPGYLAPEWFNSIISEKADVYSFGIVVMELVCGRKNLDRQQPEECMHLLPIFMKKAEENQLIEMVDKSCEDMQIHKAEAVEIMRMAIWCLQRNYTSRPTMSNVVKILEGTMEIEAELDYSVKYPTAMRTTALRADVELGTASSIYPSALSGPR